ncbi:MAG: ArsR/SmtB family transcription factor [Ilumatobacter sp.]|jgi:DNA-binding transcriptional ArsR family regulator|uniref:ArsR/SmtB family transcription factor n=1 Tax=Ilumatobacter sp. TaxID=1967498 RepID=UPI003918DF89
MLAGTATLNDDRLDETFAALANPTRRAILARLAQGEASVNQLAEPFDLSLPAISKHIKVLERAGLVTRSRRAQSRPCTIAAAPLAELASWTEQYRHIWDERFDRMDDYVRQLQHGNHSPDKKAAPQ